MTTKVTRREDLELVSKTETVDGYDPDTSDPAATLAAQADATDQVYFEGALPSGEGGVVRIEVEEVGAALAEIGDVLTGWHVTAVEPIVFSTETALEEARNRGRLVSREWEDLTESEKEELLHNFRERFRKEYALSRNVDVAARIELTRVM